MSQYRVPAKAVAIFDLVLCTVAMLWVVALVNKLDGTSDTEGEDNDFAGLDNADISILYVFAAISAIVTALKIWLAIRLLKATQIGRDTAEALRFASHWWNVSVSFLVLETIGFVRLRMYTELAINHVIRGGMIAIVYGYMQELKR